MSALTPAARDKLIACLRLWERPGTAAERDAAAAGAIPLLRAAGLTWSDVIDPSSALPAPRHVPTDWRETIAGCLRHTGDLRPWEAGFLRDLRGFPHLSVKQRAILDGIALRLGVLTEHAA